MDYAAHKVNETTFTGFLNENKESLTINAFRPSKGSVFACQNINCSTNF